MSAPIQLRLATLAARRTAGVFVVLWITIVLALAIETRPESTPTIDEWTSPHFGLARQHVWTWFLLGVAPLLVLRAVRRAAPMQAEDAAWLATRGISNATIALSTWTGVFAPWCLATCAFAAAAEIHPPPENPPPVASGTCAVPTGQWFSVGAPLVWKVTVQSDVQSATFEVGIASTHGTDGGVGAVARSDEIRAQRFGDGDSLRGSFVRGGSRGEMEVTFRYQDEDAEDAPPRNSSVEIELSCYGEGTRALILSPHATLWAPSKSQFGPSVNVALMLVLAGAAWSALALAFACFVGATTAAFGVVALWIPVWMSDWPITTTRWIPGTDLFEALTIVGSGRAPAPPTVQAWIGALVIVALALALQSFGLSRWRVSR